MKKSYKVEIELLEEVGHDNWECIDILDESEYYDNLEGAKQKAQVFKNKLKEGWYNDYIPNGENYQTEVCIFAYQVTEEDYYSLFYIYEF